MKASICERFNRTLKNKMWFEFSLRGNYKWIDMLANLMASYNNTVHRTIGMKPKDVSANNEKSLLRRVFNRPQVQQLKKQKFKIGDKVRISISKYNNIFEKGYTPNWTTEIFTIVYVNNTNPLTYRLKDYQNRSISGGFYEMELNHVHFPNIYLVEKVMKRQGNKLYVKWLGFDKSHNSWIKKSDL